mgnify:CR=1 FL=1
MEKKDKPRINERGAWLVCTEDLEVIESFRTYGAAYVYASRHKSEFEAFGKKLILVRDLSKQTKFEEGAKKISRKKKTVFKIPFGGSKYVPIKTIKINKLKK